jgi:pimeloyl-ACP methyl ester carboxylesterase
VNPDTQPGTEPQPDGLTWRHLRMALSAPRACAGLRSHWTDVRGIRTHYRAADAADTATGVPVVLLHGLAVSHRYLTPLALALAARHPVYVPDLPGFGLSAKPAGVYGPAGHARHVAALIDGWALGPACVLGHSFGAEVAARLAADHPHTVAALVLAGPTSDPAARSYRGQVGRWLFDLLLEDPRQAAVLARDARDAGPRRILGTLRTSVHNAIERDLARTAAPTLLLRGSRDPVAPKGWIERAARACAGPAETAVVPGAHNVVTTAGRPVAQRIEAFLATGVRPDRPAAGA